jgi:hypothetical protein
MKKNYFLLALLVMLCNFAVAQQFITPTSYRGAFAPAPAAMWTDQWTNFDPQNTVYPEVSGAGVTLPVVNVTSEITTDTRWTADKVYYLKAQIYVKTGATLTIDAGTVIRADHTAVGAGLFVTKGSKLIANGTASQPIIFTSDNPVGSRNKGDWGGIILLGKGAYNLNNGIGNIEGIAPSSDTQYGGGTSPDNNDNSGSLQYVRIEYAGYVYAANNEINGLTFGAVGRGTTIDYVQVSFSNDDSFEWFGGAVNCKHLVAYRGLDDDFDTDNGFSGNVQFCLGVRDPQISDAPAVSTSEGFESDNNNSNSNTGNLGTPITSAIFSNCTMVGPYYRLGLPNGGTIANGYKRGARIRRNSQLKIYNSVFTDYLEGVHVDGSYAEANATAGTLQFRNNIIAGTVTTSKVTQVNSGSTFDIASWYTASNNTTITTNSGLFRKAYDTTDARLYTGLDYRPATGSALLSGASFTEANIAAVTILVAPEVTNVTYCKGAVATPLTATLLGAGVSLKWYTVATAGTASTTAPTPLTTTVGTKTYYVSQVNAAGTESARAALTVTINALPTTPVAITGVVAQSANIGTTNPVTYSIAAVVDATSYNWTVPAGMNIISGQGTTSVVVDFAGVSAGAGAIGNLSVVSINANGCSSIAKTAALTKALPAAPTALVMTNGVTATAITNISAFVGTTTVLTLNATAATATSFNWTLPAGVNQISGGTSNIITVNFAGVASGIGTTAISVNAVNGVGTSATAKALSLTRALPTAPTALVLTNGVTTTAITDVSKYIGTTTELTLKATAAATANANSFEWTLPSGVNQISGGTSNIITVNFAGLSGPDLTSIVLSVKSVNGVGTSATAKALTVTRKLPAAVSVVTGQIGGICANSSVDYTITAPAGAIAYNITVPTGSVITSPSNPTNVTNTLTGTSDLTFTVTYSSNFATVTPKTIVITSVNNIGNSATNKLLTLTLPMTVTSVTGGTSFTRCDLKTFTAVAPGAVTYNWTVANGATIVSGQGTSSVVVDFSLVPDAITTTPLKVQVTNSCGVLSAIKSVNILSTLCAGSAKVANANANATTYNVTNIYPNPAVETFNANLDAEVASEVSMQIFSINGSLISERTISLEQGTNNITENVSEFSKGIYFVKFTNSATNETIVKKLIKE